MLKAGLRALLMALLIAMPALLLPGNKSDSSEMIALLALLAAILTFVEYIGDYPSIIEFRDAPPFNRMRFAALFTTVLVLSLICRGEIFPTPVTQSLARLGLGVGNMLDFPYSPVRLMGLVASDEMQPRNVELIRIHAGLSYLISMILLGVFVLQVRVLNWPVRRGAFNFWVNLPLFDPTAGGDVLRRLKRDAHVNVALGFLLPFLIPALMKMAEKVIDPLSLADPLTLIWTMSAWAFLSASLVMRGVALTRIAELIEEKRRRAYAQANMQAV